MHSLILYFDVTEIFKKLHRFLANIFSARRLFFFSEKINKIQRKNVKELKKIF